jgi:heme A synthase
MMFNPITKYSIPIFLSTLLALFGVGLYLPALLLPLGILLVLFVLAFSLAMMRKKYQAQHQRDEITQEEMRRKMRKSFAVLSIAMLLAVLLGAWVSGWVSGRVGNVVEVRWAGWGNIAALASAILASVIVGYLVRRGVGKFSKN